MSISEPLARPSLSPRAAADISACLERDNLTSPYFPNTSFAMFLAIAALCGVFAFVGVNRLNHTDLWGHLNFGRWMVEQGALPLVDPFAAAPSSAPVLQANWLSQLVGYLIQSWFGNEALALGHALLVTLTAGVLMLAVVRRGAPLGWAWVVGAVMLTLDLPIVGTIRPQLFGQLGLALVLLACSELLTKRHPLYWLPVVAALWANLHGSLAIGLIALGGFAVGLTLESARGAGFDFRAALRDGAVRRTWLAVLLVAVASCLNPHGWNLLWREVFFGRHIALDYITEWQTLSLTSLTGFLFICSALLAGALLKDGPSKWPLYDYVVLALFAALTLVAMRMMAWWAMVFPWVVLPHAARAWQAYCAKKNIALGSPDEPTAMRTLTAASLVFATLIFAPPSYSLIVGAERPPAAILSSDTPYHITDAALHLRLEGAFAAPLDWADYIIWQSHGKLKPLIYGHVHLATDEVALDYPQIFRGEQDWLALLRKHQVRYLFVARAKYEQLTRNVLLEVRRKNSGEMDILYEDQTALLVEIFPKQAPAAK